MRPYCMEITAAHLSAGQADTADPRTCEHRVEAWPLAANILAAAPHIHILATSLTVLLAWAASIFLWTGNLRSAGRCRQRLAAGAGWAEQRGLVLPELVSSRRAGVD